MYPTCTVCVKMCWWSWNDNPFLVGTEELQHSPALCIVKSEVGYDSEQKEEDKHRFQQHEAGLNNQGILCFTKTHSSSYYTQWRWQTMSNNRVKNLIYKSKFDCIGGSTGQHYPWGRAMQPPALWGASTRVPQPEGNTGVHTVTRPGPVSVLNSIQVHYWSTLQWIVRNNLIKQLKKSTYIQMLGIRSKDALAM
jgi:hypothetical protein